MGSTAREHGQWCGSETIAAWSARLAQIPSPGVLVSDGGSGLPSALRQVWPHTKHQRCLFHLQLNVTRHLTRNPRTTSPLEGGVNAQLRDLLKRHRGMSEEHRRRAAEWFLTLHELSLGEAISNAAMAPRKQRPARREEPEGPALYDTGLDAGEGLWERAGWAGRG